MKESMITSLLNKIPSKGIGGDSGIFFRRFTLIKFPFLSVYLHQFFRGDLDRCLHDHPWSFVSIVLCGGYYEHMESGKYWRRPGSILFRRATTAHRVTIRPGTHPYSLVFVGRKWRDWGFYTLSGWKAWRPGWSPICETDEK